MASLFNDALLLERLDVLIETTLEMLKTFAAREQRPLDQIRRYVAERHCSYLFASADLNDRRNLVQNVLTSTSQNLEALLSTASIHSFFLAIDLNDEVDEGFLGGTVAGREFWRGLRGGGSVGAKAFKSQCLRASSGTATAATGSSGTSSQTAKRVPASTLKAEVYASVRNALRAATGIRNAEMKWKNQDQLDAYGVHLIGWPLDVPMTNPSTLSVSQNKLVLEALESNKMKFVPISSLEQTSPSPPQLPADEMDVYLRYEEPPIHSSSAPLHPGPSGILPTKTQSSAPTGPSPFSVSSERSTCFEEGFLSKKRRRVNES